MATLTSKIHNETKMILQPCINWNPEWVHPYESAWGILEKFKYANSIKSFDILTLLGNQRVQRRKVPFIFKEDRDLYKLSGLDDNKTESWLGIRFLDLTKKQISKLVNPISNETRTHHQFFRSHLVFCPECIKDGFHSIFHQFKLMKLCPYHNVLLCDKCPECQSVIPYEINDNPLTSPFVCNCGYSFLQESDNILVQWKHTHHLLSSTLIQEWMSKESCILLTSESLKSYDTLTADDLLTDFASVLETRNKDYQVREWWFNPEKICDTYDHLMKLKGKKCT